MQYRKLNGQFKTDNRKWFVGWIFVILMLFGGLAGSKAMYQKVIHTIGLEIHVQNANAQVLDQFDALLKDKITATAKEYGISPNDLYMTLYCESKLQPKQSDFVKNGIRENSWGIAQINLTYHPEVTKAEALDENFSILWAVQHWYTARWYGYNRQTGKCNNATH